VGCGLSTRLITADWRGRSA